MKVNSFIRAALLGFALAYATPHGDAAAETLRVVQNGTSSDLNVSVNRAIVVESEVPFAELSIANPAIADISSLSDRSIYVLGKSPGITTLTLLDGAGQLITNVEVRVAADVTEFKERLQQILPGEKIEVRTASDGIVLSGTVSSIQKMQRALDLARLYAGERVSNLMVVGGVQQVMLKVRFAEMQRTVSKSLQSSLAFGGDISNGDVGIIGGGQRGASGAGNAGLISGALPTPNNFAGAASFGFNLGSVQVALLLEALESKGLVRVLAEPNLTTLSGQEATFLAGGEFPVPVSQENGVVTIEFKPFGVELNFVPRVVDGDLINLELQTAVSAIDPTNSLVSDTISINAFSRREASTTVELRDGESFAIAGLLQDEFRDLNNQVPWLGDVPIIGALFRSAEYRRNQSELVVIVTPHLVSPTRSDVLALPTDAIRPPSERDLFLNGKVLTLKSNKRLKGAAAEVAKQDFSGSYGYVME